MPTNILVVGGAGYIGSHMLLLLKQIGYTPIVLDNLTHGRREAVLDAELIVGDFADKKLLTEIFTTRKISAVMHYAVMTDAAQTIGSYYQNNVAALINLLDAMAVNGVGNLIYASSAAVYGEPQAQRVLEKNNLQPVNPCGRSIKMAEEIIADYAATGKLRYAILRHFNVAGADPAARIGESQTLQVHLIPLLLQVAAGKKPSIIIFGDAYPTADGTAIRDYIHVSDVCAAHLLALNALQKKPENLIFNLGTGRGFTVKQVINTVRRVTGKSITEISGKPRVGAPAVLIANVDLIKQELRWLPKYSELDTIILHAWQYLQKNPQ